MCKCVLCVSVCLYLNVTVLPNEAKEGTGWPEAGVAGGCEPLAVVDVENKACPCS